MSYDYEIAYKKNTGVCGTPFREIVNFFNNYEKTNASILDLGCGQGRNALFISALGHRVTGVDISPTGISQINKNAEKNGLKIEGIVKDIIIFKTRKRFDIIILDRILHMLSNVHSRIMILNRVISYTKKNGYVLIADTPSNKKIINDLFSDKKPNWITVKSKKGFHFFKKVL